MVLSRGVVLLVLAIMVSSCQYEEVDVEDIRNFQIKRVEKNQISLGFEVKVTNPNAYSIKISSTDLNCSINRRDMGKLKLDEKLIIPAGNDDYLQINSSLTTNGAAGNMLSILLSSLLTQSVDVHLTGNAKAGLFIFPKTIEIDHREKVELNNGRIY